MKLGFEIIKKVDLGKLLMVAILIFLVLNFFKKEPEIVLGHSQEDMEYYHKAETIKEEIKEKDSTIKELNTELNLLLDDKTNNDSIIVNSGRAYRDSIRAIFNP